MPSFRHCLEITISPTRQNLAVPFAMKSIASEVDQAHLFVRDLDPRRIGAVVNLGMDFQSLSRGGCGNLTHEHLQTYERFPAPVFADEGKQAVFNLVPFAGSRRKVTHGDGDPGLVGQPL